METVSSDESSSEEIELKIVEEDWDEGAFDTDLWKGYASDTSCSTTSYTGSITSKMSSWSRTFMLNIESPHNEVCYNSEINGYRNGQFSCNKGTENRRNLQQNRQVPVENKQCFKIIKGTEGNDLITERHELCDRCKNESENPLTLQCSHCICLKCTKEIARYENKDSVHSHLGNKRSNSDLNYENVRWQDEINCLYGIICPICNTELCTRESVTKSDDDSQVTSKSNNPILCTSCVEEECSIAVSRCDQCDEYLCTICVAFHKRQRKTRHHELSNLRNEVRQLNGLRDNVCLKHQSMQLRFYCQDCKISLCDVCCVDEHILHNYEEISSDIEKYKDKMTSLMNDSISKENELSSLITTLLEKENRIKSNTDRKRNEVNLHFDGFIAAVEKHRHILLKQVENISKTKIDQIQGEVLKLTNILKQCSNVHEDLQEAVNVCLSKEIIDIHRKCTDRLNNISKTIANTNTQHLIPGYHTDSMAFCPDAEACVIDNFQMYGLLVGTQVSPKRCYISGDGLQTARVGHQSTLTVHTRDNNDLACLRDVKIKYFLRSSGIQRYTPVSAHKNKDGTYTLSFTPKQHGEHRLIVLVQDEAIEGSPFCFSVKRKWREHSGRWHCCTFCSTHGRMDEMCVHGSSKHDFTGCVHSNRNHPGGPHWSCCGKMTETSECLLLPSYRKPRSLSQRDIYHGNINNKRSFIREVTL